jgi:hypothetical protein
MQSSTSPQLDLHIKLSNPLSAIEANPINNIEMQGMWRRISLSRLLLKMQHKIKQNLLMPKMSTRAGKRNGAIYASCLFSL